MLIGSGCVDGGEHTPCETWFGMTAIIAFITMKQTSSEAICIIRNSVVSAYQLQLSLYCKLALNALWMKDSTPLSCISQDCRE